MTTAALILIAVLLFELIIFCHELGHFITAKKSGVKVNEFALGMGPKIFSFQKGETLYSLRAFPIGGFCAMEGEDEDSENPRAFNNAKIWKRMIIIVAGAFMNIVLGMVLLCITLLPAKQFTTTSIDDFVPYSFSAVTGLEKGDDIVSINGYATNTSTDFSFALYTLPLKEVDGSTLSIYKEDCVFELYSLMAGSVTKKTTQDEINEWLKIDESAVDAINKANSKKEALETLKTYYAQMQKAIGVKEDTSKLSIEEKKTRKRFRTDMTVKRDGKKIELNDVDFFTGTSGDQKEPSLSIDFYVKPLEKNVGTVITQTFSQTVSVVRMVWGSLIGLIKGQFGLNELSGPIGIASAITDVAGQTLKTSGFGSAVMSIVYVMMVISVNLGVVNMLPFPALDGGRFLMLLIEAIFRKPVPRKVESIINTVGLVLLLGLSAVIAVKDVWQLIAGG